MKKLLLLPLLLAPMIITAPVEAHHRKPRCRTQGKVVVCKMPRNHCTRKRPCIPSGYYRSTPPIRIPNQMR